MSNNNLEILIKEINVRKEILLIESDLEILFNNKLSLKDLKLEEDVLCSMIDSIPTLSTLINLVYKDFFVSSKNQKIMDVLTEIYGYSGKPDITTISKELKKNGTFDMVGGFSFLEYLSNKN